MDVGDWIALGGTVFALIMQSIGVAIYVTRVAAQVSQNAKSIERLERNDAECEGKMSGMRQEFSDRTELLSNKFTSYEQHQNAQTAALNAGLAKIEATFTASLTSLKESVDRLYEAERQRAIASPPAQPDLIGQLRQFAELQKMFKSVA